MEYVIYAAIAILAILGTLYITKHQNKKAFRQVVDVIDNEIKKSQTRQEETEKTRQELNNALENLRSQLEDKKDSDSKSVLDNFEKKYRQ